MAQISDEPPSAAPTIPTDGDPRPLQAAGAGGTGALDALVGVEHRGAALPQRLLERLSAEGHSQRMGQLLGQCIPTPPVGDRHQIHAARGQTDIRDLRTPDLVGAARRDRAQEIRVARVLLGRRAGARFGGNGLHPHAPPQTLDACSATLSANVVPLIPKAPADMNGHTPTFNRTTEMVDWAWWTWNPVTVCLHDCAYCYARDIATRLYPEKFEPTMHYDRLKAPHQTNVPAEAATDVRAKSVFVCSMADLFGKWVPQDGPTALNVRSPARRACPRPVRRFPENFCFPFLPWQFSGTMPHRTRLVLAFCPK
jgi:hypothetical protein